MCISRRGFTPDSVPTTAFSLDIIDQRPGLTVLRIEGKGAEDVFRHEPGGHRFQRVPPTEKRGRVHTSTITVAVLPEPTQAQVRIEEKDLEVTVTRGSGAGGQKRNKTENVPIMRHLPTGIVVRCESERSLARNKEIALALLRAKIWERMQSESDSKRAAERRKQLGSGQRGDKRRTVAVQRDSVVDHLTGRTWTYRQYTSGKW